MKWIVGLLIAHVCSIVGTAAVYGIIAFGKQVPFYEIFEYPETAPYYIVTYVFVLSFTLTFIGVGLVMRNIFESKDFRTQLVARGFLVMGVLGSLLPITLITMWDLALKQPVHTWSNLVLAAQHFTIWVALVTAVLFGCIMLVIFSLARDSYAIPRGWSWLTLALAFMGACMALTSFGVPRFLELFRIVYLIGGMCYLSWTLWLIRLVQKIKRTP